MCSNHAVQAEPEVELVEIIKDASGNPQVKITLASGETRIVSYDPKIAGSLDSGRAQHMAASASDR